MTASMFFSQTIPQTHSPGLENGQMRTSVQEGKTARKTIDAYSGNDGEGFSSIMKQITKDLNQKTPARVTRQVKSTETHMSDSVEKLFSGKHTADTLELGTFEQTPLPVDNLVNTELQMPQGLNFLEIIDTLEKLGFPNLVGGASSSNNMDGMLSSEGDRTTLKMLMTRLGQNDFMPSAEMKVELDRILRLIASVQTDNGLSHNNGDPEADLTDSRSAASSDLDQLLRHIASNQKELSSNSGGRMGESHHSEKSTDPFAATLQNDTRQAKSFHAVGDSQSVSRTEIQEKTESLKFTVEARTVGAEDNKNAQESKSLETFRPDEFGHKDGLDPSSKNWESSQTGLIKRISTTLNSWKENGGESALKNLPSNEFSSVIKMTNDAQTSKASNAEQRYNGDAVQNNAVNNASSPITKMIHDSILAKENQLKIDAILSDELGGKVIKVDVGTNNDNGLLSSQNQNVEKAFEATSLSRHIDSGQESLRNQTLDQIVRKAVIYMRNGQHAAKIDLKPEFLGHVRMQVITENHQVSIKIFTEFGFVKDMVENNIQQLKTDLQQQGLNVDKLEVAVSDDTDEHKNRQQKTGQSKNTQQSATRIDPDNGEEEALLQIENLDLRDTDTAAVDYFA
ncbi:MAG: flagellar hook-length control protein FliK [Desulfobacterales bacterium]|jgi:flagellar hook-length control protein FliK